MTYAVRKLSITAMGIALFVALTLCLQVPVFENYYLCLGYLVISVYCYYFGPWSAAAVGGIGVVLYCIITSGLRGMPGWAIGNLVIGLTVGYTVRFTKRLSSKKLQYALILTSVIISTAIAILGVKSFVEYLLYAQPFVLRIAKNFYACVADVIVLMIGFPVSFAIRSFMHKTFPQFC